MADIWPLESDMPRPPCPDCAGPMDFRAGAFGPYWRCHVPGCPGSISAYPDGRLRAVPGDQETRQLRIQCHAALDARWTTKAERREMYLWLADQMGIRLHECHFSRMDKAQCRRALTILTGEA